MESIERAVGKDVERVAVFAAEEQIDGTLGYVDGVDELALRVVDEDLARGDVDIPLGILCDAFTATFNE